MRVLLMLNRTPRWANGGRAEYAPKRPRDLADFVPAAAHRYPSRAPVDDLGRAVALEQLRPFVQPPHGTRITRAQKRAPHRYARMLDAGYGALKRERRNS